MLTSTKLEKEEQKNNGVWIVVSSWEQVVLGVCPEICGMMQDLAFAALLLEV